MSTKYVRLSFPVPFVVLIVLAATAMILKGMW